MSQTDENTIEIVAIHVANRWALTGNNELLEITSLYDCDGVETQDPVAATIGIAQCDEGWICIELEGFEEVEPYH